MRFSNACLILKISLLIFVTGTHCSRCMNYEACYRLSLDQNRSFPWSKERVSSWHKHKVTEKMNLSLGLPILFDYLFMNKPIKLQAFINHSINLFLMNLFSNNLMRSCELMLILSLSLEKNLIEVLLIFKEVLLVLFVKALNNLTSNESTDNGKGDWEKGT